MAGETQARRRKIRNGAKDTSNGNSSDRECDESSTEGSTCLSALVTIVLLAGVGVLLGMMSLDSGVPHGSSLPVQRPSARPAAVVVEGTAGHPHPQPSQAAQSVDPSTGGGDVAAPLDAAAPPSSSAAAVGPDESAADGEPAGPVAHVTAPAPARADRPSDMASMGLTSGGTPLLSAVPDPVAPPPPPAEGLFQLEGSEPPEPEPTLQKVERQVRVRQVIRQHTYADGSVSEEVVSERILQEGDEGYDDLGEEPVVIEPPVGAGGG